MGKVRGVMVMIVALLVGAPAVGQPVGGTRAAPEPASPKVPWLDSAWDAPSVPATQTPGGQRLLDVRGDLLSPCADDDAFLCGTVAVPLDRREPDARTVGVGFVVFPHTGPAEQPAGAVFVTCGGPGCSITSGVQYGYAFGLLPSIAKTRDLVFIDQRGVGLSDPIDCPALQAQFNFPRPVAGECHDQLGGAADLYSTTDVADDLEDVRAALGYDQIDLIGASYAGLDMTTYAVRHTEHVRSVVLASPVKGVGEDLFFSDTPEAMPGVVASLCRRSPACAAANPRPGRSFARLARQLAEQPLEGTGLDSAGGEHVVRVTEQYLANQIAFFNGAHFTGAGEVTPAAAAWRRGDPVPLLRLAADADPRSLPADDVRVFSAGHNLARFCVDTAFPFDKEAPAAQRRQQYAAAYDAEPDFYGPIAKDAWARTPFIPAACITRRWEDRSPYPAGTQVPGVPTLVLGGEYDLIVTESVSRLSTEVLVDSTYVSMAAAGHDPQFWSACGARLVQRFIADLAVADTSCADEPAGGWWVPGRFMRRIGEAPPAEQATGAPAARRIRRLVTATAWTVMDSLQHNFFIPGDSVGLRGGDVVYTSTDTGGIWTLEGVRFTADLTVDGTVVVDFPPAGPTVTARVTAVTRGGRTLEVRLEGLFLVPGEQFTVSARVDGAVATFTVPSY